MIKTNLNRNHISRNLDDKLISYLSISFLCISSLVFSSSLFAQGVIAGTDISNTVIVNYTIDGQAQIPIESSPSGNVKPGVGNGEGTFFKVDRKIDLTVTGVNNTNVSPGDIQSVVTFTLVNDGNDMQEFSLTTNSLLNSDKFDTNNCISTITAVSGTPLVTLPTIGNIKLEADQQASISVSCDIPLILNSTALQSGENSLLSLTATAVKNSDDSIVNEATDTDIANEIETVFADAAGSDDNERDASHSARREYVTTSSATPASLIINKSIVSIIDTTGGNSAVTGSEVIYKITILTTGNGDITNLIITDLTPAQMQYKNETIILNNITQTDTTDTTDGTDFGSTTANTATINLGNIAAGSQHEIQLTYIIN